MSSSTKPRSSGPINSAPERRRDLVTGQWFLLAAERAERPYEFLASADTHWSDSCAFCAGRESETTPTIASYPPPASSRHAHPWQVRVVDNLYPILTTDFAATALSAGTAASCSAPSWGRHEVIIESPLHQRQLTELDSAERFVIFDAYRDRLRSLRAESSLKSVLIFKNSGRDAGMSREHLHSQLVALPHVPPLLQLELDGASRFWDACQECVFCHLAAESQRDGRRLVLETDSLLAFCPFASRTAYEVWIQPKCHAGRYENCNDQVLVELAQIVAELLSKLSRCLGHFAYNYVLHTLPFDTCLEDHYHWHIEIIPRTSRLAGLEWGGGLLVNTVAPETAADRLRNSGER